MTKERLWIPHSRRHFLQSMSVAAVGASVAPAAGDPARPSRAKHRRRCSASRPRRCRAALRILLWSHFVPSADEWFDLFAQAWGEQVGVDVTVDHINNAEIVP